MAYASITDIAARNRTDDFLLVAESAGAPGELDATAVQQALDDASGEMDVYIGKRYSLPLEHSPAILARLCLDIALYQLGVSAHGNTEEKRQRYEDAIRLLKSIAKGEVDLGLVVPGDDGEPPAPQIPDAEITYNTRLFCRNSMQGVA